MTVFFWIAAAALLGLAAPYVVYPLVVRCFQRRPFATDLELDEHPVVSVLIPAHNEADSIEAKIENTLALVWPSDKLEIIIGSDGSTDETEAIVSRYAHRGVTLLPARQRRGKSATLQAMRDVASGTLVVFSDATAMLPANAVTAMATALVDPTVGAAGARYATRAQGERVGEAGYWRAMSMGHVGAAERGVLLGLHGSAYMVRRALVPNLPNDTVNDDYVIPMSVRAAGHRVQYLADVVVTEAPANALATVFHRMVRIAVGNLQMLTRNFGLLSPTRGRVGLPLSLYKLPKTLSPWLLLALLASATTLSVQTGAAWIAAAVWGPTLVAFGALAWVAKGLQAPSVVRIAAYAAMSQVAYLIGSVRFCMGHRPWRRAPENEPLDIDAPLIPPLSVRFTKRLVDVVGATVGLILGAPIMVVVAAAVRLDSRGPSVYAQVRVGSDGQGRQQSFTMYKFRSMRQDAEVASGPVWASEADPRVTRVGAVLRKLRLDELPQLFNVLRGDMSLVGPRPERPVFTEKFDESLGGYTDRVARCRPGITGWAQVNCAYDTSIESVRHKLAYDLAYSAHLRGLRPYLFMEIRVLFRTIAVCLTGSGAR